jgi:hypothetical protein
MKSLDSVAMQVAAREFLRALRGKRSQKALSRRLGYQGNPVCDWGARYLGISVEAIDASLALLQHSNVIRKQGRHYQEQRPLTVDTRGSEEVINRLLTHWLGVATQRVEGRSPRKLFAYNLVSVSEVDFQRIRALLTSMFREIAAIVAASEPAQTVAMLGLQWLALGDTEGASSLASE